MKVTVVILTGKVIESMFQCKNEIKSYCLAVCHRGSVILVENQEWNSFKQLIFLFLKQKGN